MRIPTYTACLLFLAGCTAERLSAARRAAAPVLDCPLSKVQVAEDERYWIAKGCGQEAHCDTYRGQWVCEPVEAAAPARPVPTVDTLIVDRLTVETSCPRSSIAVTASSGGASRLIACGKTYVCFIDAAAHIDCKRALEESAGN